jgi:hypothetical protein
MLKKYVFMFILVAGLLCGGCASIVSKSTWPVAVSSNPADATIVVKNKHGVEMYKAVTPTMIMLQSGDGYFSTASYTIEGQKEGYNKKVVTVSPQLNPWYVGNLIFGGLIGLLTVDPLTGAMWKFDESSLVILDPDPNYGSAPVSQSVATPAAAKTEGSKDGETK